jgi:hypothetical protein
MLQSAVESVTKIQALEMHISEVEDALGRSEALRADLQVRFAFLYRAASIAAYRS